MGEISALGGESVEQPSPLKRFPTNLYADAPKGPFFAAIG
jgi:hypothetical protein